jgi:nitric oxide reductase subunit B
MSSANTHFGGLRFMRLGMLALAGGMVFGVIGGFQFLFPEFLQELLFTKTRPLHVSLVVSSIFLIAIGGVYFYLPRQCNLPLFSSKSVDLHYWVFLLTGLAIIVSYLSGRFGGREYFEFPPILSLPIFLTWLLFGINYFNTVRQDKEPWPVYYWMWGTGVVFFFITYAESHLYLIPYFRETMVREIMVQWKSYGALTGSWNMLVYGTGLYLATKIGGCDKFARSKMAFGLYFLGLFNLMFGWAHHTYLVPSDPWIRTFAYLVSMTELYIFGKIIWDWRSSLTDWQKNRHCNAYRFLIAADIWVFVNLALALIISIPALNLFTHGTHITVAHAMGSTIGINMMILLASVFYVIREELPDEIHAKCFKQLRTGFWLSNVSLAIFFVALLLAGIGKGVYDGSSFQEMMLGIRPFLVTFAISGVTLMTGLWIILWHGFRLMGKIMAPAGVAEPQPA